ncbi:hypothetical protein RBWH47_00940 [Rhodopirellula baltica WH47]|uniref:Uncharacterized protein n=1 Tax=Rhodopirellula baltica WH47 TaxID=991778 RepID=F2B1M0_RHOBT|nr:hypothetical protein RBWH47_00940 [Rhodopirellula baltica WH47]
MVTETIGGGLRVSLNHTFATATWHAGCNPAYSWQRGRIDYSNGEN